MQPLGGAKDHIRRNILEAGRYVCVWASTASLTDVEGEAPSSSSAMLISSGNCMATILLREIKKIPLRS